MCGDPTSSCFLERLFEEIILLYRGELVRTFLCPAVWYSQQLHSSRMSVVFCVESRTWRPAKGRSHRGGKRTRLCNRWPLVIGPTLDGGDKECHDRVVFSALWSRHGWNVVP